MCLDDGRVRAPLDGTRTCRKPAFRYLNRFILRFALKSFHVYVAVLGTHVRRLIIYGDWSSFRVSVDNHFF